MENLLFTDSTELLLTNDLRISHEISTASAASIVAKTETFGVEGTAAIAPAAYRRASNGEFIIAGWFRDCSTARSVLVQKRPPQASSSPNPFSESALEELLERIDCTTVF